MALKIICWTIFKVFGHGDLTWAIMAGLFKVAPANQNSMVRLEAAHQEIKGRTPFKK